MTYLSNRLLVADENGLSTVAVVIIVLIAIALLALFVAALVSILRSPVLTATGKLVWVIVVLVLQFFGPLAWFFFGRKWTAGSIYRDDRPDLRP